MAAKDSLIDRLSYLYLKKVYADHNNSSSVNLALRTLLSRLPSGAIGLNVGAGKTQFDSRFKNLEIEPGDGIDYVGSVERIPCESESFDIVITQEVLEHVESPWVAVAEIHRVLKQGGRAFIQVPFVIGYHPCPGDYWRFTHEGLATLMRTQGFEIIQEEVSVGPAVGFYRILVEFWAILFSVPYHGLYRPAKFLFSLLFYPIKLLDPLMLRSKESNRISGGYFIVCQKTLNI